MKTMLWVSATVAALSSWADAPTVTDCGWKGFNGVYDGVVTDTAHWTSGIVPGALDQAVFNQTADYTVRMPDDGWETLATLKPMAAAGHVLSLDTRNSYLLQKAAESDNYGVQPFHVQADAKPLVRLETTHYAAAQSRVADALMTVKSATADSAQPFPSFSVTGGSFNLLDPDGTMPDYFNDWKMFMGVAAADARIAYSDCTVRLPTVVFHGAQTGVAELSFSDCPVHVGGQLKFCDNNRAEPATNLVRFANGTQATLSGGLYLDNTRDALGLRMTNAACLVAEGEGTVLDVGTGITYGGNWDNTLNLEARDGAAVSFAGGCNWRFAEAKATGSPNPKARAELTVSDATVAFGSEESPALSVVFGHGHDALSTLTVTGDSKVDFHAGGNQSFGYNSDDNMPSEGALNVEGGTVVFHEGNSYRVYLGVGAATAGRVTVSGGRLVVEGGYGLGVHKGVGCITVSGGEMAVSRLPICSEESSAPETVVRQTGGVITVSPRTEATKSLTDMKGVQITTNGKTTRKARLVLDGGVMNANYVIGGSSAEANGGTGCAAFEANGGTLRANAVAPFLLETFDEAKLGPKGLTIDSDYAATVRQPFVNQDAASGRLTLAGSGVKTLTGVSTVSDIVVAGGEVAFDAAACPRSRVLVKNGALVNFNGGAADGSLVGLTLGDGQSSARLAVAAGETFLVSGDLSVVNVRLVLSGDFAYGSTNAILRCTGALSEASAEAWRKALVSSGLADGLAGDFIVSVQGDEKVLSLVVRESLDVILRVDEGVSNVVDAVQFAQGDTLRMIVGEGARLNVSGRVAYGSVAKEGNGAAWLTADDNHTSGRIAINAGLLAGTSVAAFGWNDSALPGTLLLGNGTLGLSDLSGEADFPWAVTMSAPESDAACVVKTDSPFTFRHLALGTGCLIKRGAGRLTLAAPSGTVTFSSSAGKNSAGGTVVPTTVSFPDGGVPPQANYAGLTIVEGELRLTGGASYQVASGNTPGVTYVGVPVKGIGAEPGIVVDGTTARFSSQGSRHFHLGCGITDANSDVRRPYLIATNGATVNVTSFVTGRDSSGSVAPRVHFDASTLNVSEYLYTLRGGTEGATPTYSFVNGSRLHVDYNGMHGVEFQGGYATMVFDDSVLARNENNDRARIWVYDGTGRMLFRNGGKLYADTFYQSNDNRKLTLAFDGGEWSPSDGNYELSATYPQQLVFVAEGDGLLLAPSAGATWRMAGVTFAAGPGAVTIRGQGKVYFSEGVAERGVRFAGTGGLSGFLTDPVLSVPLCDDGTVAETLCLEDISVSGRVSVDFGRTAENPAGPLPENLTVARFSGAAPDVGSWKVTGVGVPQARGLFRVVGNAVVVDVVRAGFLLKVR